MPCSQEASLPCCRVGMASTLSLAFNTCKAPQKQGKIKVGITPAISRSLEQGRIKKRCITFAVLRPGKR